MAKVMRYTPFLIGVILVALFLPAPREEQEDLHDHATHSPPMPVTQLAIAPLAQTALNARRGSVLSASESVSAGCVREWASVLALDLTKAMTSPLSGGMLAFDLNTLGTHRATIARLGLGKACATLEEEHPLHEWSRRFIASCGRSEAELSGAELSQCAMDLLAYRAHLVDEETRKTPLESLSEPSILVHKFYAAYFGNSEPDTARMGTVADRLLALSPESEAIAGLALRARYMDYIASAKEERHAAAERALEEVVDRIRVSHPGSDAAVEAKLNIARMKRDYSLLRKIAEEHAIRNPASELPAYYLAWAEHLSGNAKAAESLLAERLATSPHSPHVESVLGALRGSGHHLALDDKGLPLAHAAAPPFSELDTSLSISFLDAQ